MTWRNWSTGLAYAGGLLTACAALPAHAGPIVIGGFDANRGGFESLTPANDPNALLSPYTGSQENSALAADIANALPGTQFLFSNTLTSSFLGNVSAVILGVATTEFSAITPLSVSEQTALRNFVLGGGTALIFADNATFDANAPAANASLLSPFGVTATGILGGNPSAPLLNPNGPLTGPFGPVDGLFNGYPGYFNETNGGQVLAVLDGDPTKAAIDYFAPGALGPTSGLVVLFSDSDAMVAQDGLTTGNLNLILNALSVPESDTLAIFAACLAGLVFARRRRGVMEPRSVLRSKRF